MRAPAVRDEIRALHRAHGVIDLHVDVILQQRLFGYDITKRHRPWVRRQPFFRHADIPRMVEGAYALAVLGIHYWRRETERGWLEVRRQLDYMEHVAAVDERVVLASCAWDVERAKENGQLALMAGLEGAHLINADLDRLDEAAARHVAYMTLAHFSRNAAATPGMGKGANQLDGLTPFGRKLVARLNELGILVDVAHVNRPGVLDACDASVAPVIATHTTAVALHDNNRGLTDEGIRAVAATGGVIGIIFSPHFLCGRLNAPVSCVVEHMSYVADLVGVEHVAVGSDFDGWIPTIPNDIRDCRDLALITQQLVDHGFSEQEVGGILGGNFLRVFRQVRGR